MKKIIKKLAIFILTSFLINTLVIGTSVFANGSEVPKNAREQINTWSNSACEKKFEDAKVIIKFYEPLVDESPPRSEIIDCYQHSLVNDPNQPDVPKFTLGVLTNNEATCNTEVDINGAIHTCQKIQVLLSNSGTLVMYTYIGYIYRFATNIVGLIAVMIIIFSGIQIATSGGDTEVLSSAKSRIIKSLGGIAVLFLSGLILYTVNPTFYTIATQ